MKGLNKVKLATIAIALSIVVAAPVAFAGGPGGHGKGFRGHRGPMGGMFFRDLNLTDAQKAQIQQIHESHRQAMEPVGQEIRTKRQELHQLTEGATLDETLIRQKLTEIAGLEAKVMVQRHQIEQEMLNVLTPEQRTQLDAKKAEMKSKWQERRAERQGQGSNQ